MGDSVGSAQKSRLRMITYLSPSVPIELFEVLRDYLEEKLDVEASIIYESRWSGPPAERDPDPFQRDEVDMGFMCASGFLRLINEGRESVELCPAGAVHQHPNNNNNRPIYFSDVIIHSDNSSKYKDFHDLKGHRWAINDEISLSGNLMALAELRKMGFNASFFGNILRSGSNINSLQMVLEKKVDAASVDSTCLHSLMKKDPSLKKSICVITSLGPMPIHPTVFNTRLSDDLKTRITSAMLTMHEFPKWKERLGEFNLRGFVPTDMSLYQLETSLREVVKSLSVNTAYY
ncbi:uncharacterized protein LOC135476247 [Liolophura sinensis]|uniref:uncharacterized protein LOC135476247 n=1 Tax=Liolophura sinensis TaxID=3198878 RepID=UPI003158C843